MIYQLERHSLLSLPTIPTTSDYVREEIHPFNLQHWWLLDKPQSTGYSKKLLYQMTCRKPGMPPRCLINLTVPSQNLWLEFSHLYPQPVHKGFKDFTNHNFCFEVWIKYAHTFLCACYFVKGVGIFSTIMCWKIGLWFNRKDKEN